MRKVLCVTALFFLVITGAFAQQKNGKPYDLYQIGQSYRTPMNMVQFFAETRGKSFRVKSYLPPGVPIHAHWKAKERGRKFVKNGRFKTLCMIPYYDFKEDSPDAAAGFYGLALEQDPNVRVYVVDHWPKRSMPKAEKDAWFKENLPKFELMAEVANKKHPNAKNPVRVVPRANAFRDFLKYADQIPGFSAPASAYNDGGHASNNSNYMFATMEYAWIFGDTPIGLPARAERTRKGKTEEMFRLTEEQALALQRIGYHNLTTHPTSGVTVPADSTAPATPNDVKVTLSPKSVLLSWPEVEDEGVGVHRYVLTRDDGRTFENVIARFEDRTIESGKTYKYQIAAVDFAGNKSSSSAPVTAVVPQDKKAPEIVSVQANETAQTVRVMFNEAVEPESATKPGNYGIAGSTVEKVRMAGPDVVMLLTTPMKEGSTYELKVRNVSDTATPANSISLATSTFAFTPPKWKPFNLTKWEGAEAEMEGPQVRLTAKGEGKLRSFGKLSQPAMVGFYKEVEGDFVFPVTITSQGQVAANAKLKPYQRRGIVKTGIILAEDVTALDKGKFAVFYLDDSTRFKLTVHRDWLVTSRVIGAGLGQGDPRKNRNGLDFPIWLRLVRNGSDLTAWYSLTGVGADDWQELGTIPAKKMPQKIQLGIFNISGVDNEHSTAMFDLRASGKEKGYTNAEEQD